MRLARHLPLLLAALLLSKAHSQDAAELVAPFDPTQHWEVDYESGLLWRVTGSATPLSYTVAPQMITLKSPLVGVPRTYSWGDVVLRSRFSLLLEPIVAGPEHHFIGVTASGIMEWWDKRRTRAFFIASGGGFGWLDSKGHQIAGAQGEDFNFTWLLYPGVRFMFRDRVSASLGAYFQHISNRNLNRVNPGLNAAGPMLSVGWHF
jgi:lipid A 3-O-deacylase